MPPITKKCRITNEEFEISEFEQEFCKKMDVPLPTMNRTERMRKLSSFGNYINLFSGTCSATGKKIIQAYHPNEPFPIYTPPYWWSDKWDPLDYAKDYDFSLPFFRQFKKLRDKVPQQSLSVGYETLENCDYINGASYNKNCYLTFGANDNEDIYYTYYTINSKDCIDCNACLDCELCYQSTFVTKCYDVRYAFNTKNSKNSAFLWNCMSCENRFGCVNSRHKKYCFLNEQLTKEQYEDKVKNIEWDNYEVMENWWNKFVEFVKTNPQPAIHGFSLENCTGDFIVNSKNAFHAFKSEDLQDCFNVASLNNCNDCMDFYSWGTGSELIYNTSGCGYSSSNIKFCNVVYMGSSDLDFCIQCVSCKNCFGCISLRNKQYCIFNKQYTKDEYFELRSRILAQFKDQSINSGEEAYGEYFPSYISLFKYNFSEADLYFPLSKNEVEKRGFVFGEEIPENLTKSISWENVPVKSSDIDDNIIKETFACVKTGRPFKIIKQELKIYKERKIPLPRKHWKLRIKERNSLINPYIIYDRTSAKSGITIKTTYPPDSQWIVWSNEEYTKEFGA